MAASCTQKALSPVAAQEGSHQKNSYKERTKLGIKLTDLGNNTLPQFSWDGNELLYLSDQRKNHKQSQLYAVDLGTYQERRLTFQDGQIYDALPFSKTQVTYSSTTDENKERPRLFYPDLAEIAPAASGNSLIFPPTEIYVASLQGLSIERLTEQAGFDGLISLNPNWPESILFSKWQEGHLQLWQLNI